MAFGDVVQSNSGTSSTATTAPTLGSATTAGNLIVLTFAADDYNASPNAGWTQSSEMEQQTFHGGYLWWLTATASMTIPSYTIGSAVRSAWTLVEYAGPFDASPYDVSEGQFQQSPGTSTAATASMTPTAGDRLMVAGLNAQHAANDLTAWATFTNSFTEAKASLFNGANPRLAITQLRRVVTANGSTAYTTGGTTGASGGNNPQSMSETIIAFKAGAGGGGTTYNDTTAETASAAETAGGLLTTTKAIAETAASAETATGLLVTAKAVAESASAAETATGLLTFTGAIAEVASAQDTHFAVVIPAGGTLYDDTVAEALAANDTLTAKVVVLWTPASITTGMVAWFDGADAATLTFSGSNLTQWSDKSPAANHATPFVTGPTLTSINSLGSLSFNSQTLHTTTAISLGDLTVFVVFKAMTGGNYERLVDQYYQEGFWLGRRSSFEEWGGGVRNTVDPFGRFLALTDGVTHQLSSRRSGATHTISANGGASSLSGSGSTTATTSNLIGIGGAFNDAASGDRLNGDIISEVIIWSNALSAADMASTEGYLAWKWDIEGSLPLGHPYKDAPPGVETLLPAEVTLPAGGLSSGGRRRVPRYTFPRFEIVRADDDEDEKPRRKRKLQLKKAEIREKVEAAVEYIAAGSPRPMSQKAMVAEVSTLLDIDALLEADRKRIERTIYRYIAALLAEEEDEEIIAFMLAA